MTSARNILRAAMAAGALALGLFTGTLGCELFVPCAGGGCPEAVPIEPGDYVQLSYGSEQEITIDGAAYDGDTLEIYYHLSDGADWLVRYAVQH